MDRLAAVTIDPEIRRARTLPAWIYSDAGAFSLQRERVFARSWQWVADADRVKVPGAVQPVSFLEGALDEPLVLSRDRDDQLHCFSNVCTHRGTIVCEQPAVESFLRCRYHGRRFALDGKFLSMPEFEGVEGFPSDADNLRHFPFGQLGKLIFAALAPACPFDELAAELRSRCGFLPWDRAVYDATRSREYLVQANWALYCDNYLEGFHIPYVHAGLAQAIDYGSYRSEVFRWSTLQLGVTQPGVEAFAVPAGHPDAATRVGAYYWWLFPNTMLNLYPWGISLNVVHPLAVDRTKVSFVSFVWDDSKLDRGAGMGLDRVEREDEVVVESVQRGTRSRFYERGRYSPARENGVHRFHQLLVEAMKKA
jgi:choline monooxygenase